MNLLKQRTTIKNLIDSVKLLSNTNEYDDIIEAGEDLLKSLKGNNNTNYGNNTKTELPLENIYDEAKKLYRSGKTLDCFILLKQNTTMKLSEIKQYCSTEFENIINLNTCSEGDILISSQGTTLRYIAPTPYKHLNYLDHVVEYLLDEDGKPFDKYNDVPLYGTRTNDGFTFKNNRIPETDQDIIKIIHK